MSPGSDLPVEISVSETQELLSAGKIVLLDVREHDEFQTAKIEGSTLVPMSEIQQRVDEVKQLASQRMIVHCHHGGRSLRVVQWLRGQGVDQVQNMTGGIDAWSQEIDPAVPRY